MNTKDTTKKRANLLYTLLATFKRCKYSQWVDVGCFEVSGKYFLMQMQFDLDTNKKRFRRARMGWVNDYTSKAELYMKIIKVGKVEFKTKDKVCGKCKSELQYEQKDVQNDRDGRYIICPVCGQFIAVQ